MPLQSGSSQETISKNIHEMVVSESFARGKSRKKKQEMAVAAALSMAKRGRKKGKKHVAKH